MSVRQYDPARESGTGGMISVHLPDARGNWHAAEKTLIPCTRLVRIFSALIQYLFRRYILYRSRDPKQFVLRPPRRGWKCVDIG